MTDPAGARALCSCAAWWQSATERERANMEDLLGVGKAVAIDYGSENSERRGWVEGHAFVQVSVGQARPFILVHLVEGFWDETRTNYVSLLVCHPDSVTALLPDEDVRDPRFMRVARMSRRRPARPSSAELEATGRYAGEALEDEVVEVPGCGGWAA